MAASIATSIAAPIAANTIEKLLQKLANEGSLVVNFRKDFQWLTRELTFTKAYLKDAHQKSIQNDFVKQWLSELSDVVLDAEDIVDECAVESRYQHSWLIIFKYKIGRRIRDLKGRMSSIVADATQFRLFRDLNPSEQQPSTSSSGAEQWKRPSVLERNARPVAIGAKVDEIIRLLDDDAHQVIGVVGMGGVGKTFLLQNVYNDPRTKGRFEKCIWLSISQTYSLPKLQSDLASSLDLRDVVGGYLSEQKAAELIRESLHGKKFLVVLDDVWRATEHDNLIEKLGVPTTNTLCKVLITTRSKEVCRVMNASSIYDMEVLEEGDSWNLFCVYAFPDYPDNRPPRHLKEIARQIESKCGRLPLALKMIGASMTNQPFVEQWESKLQKLKTVSRLEDPIMEILQLSYDCLRADLKPCFLYFSFFGEEKEIDVDYLIELWRAEGFIPEGDVGRTTGLDYFYKLCNLCLVDSWENEFQHKFCKIHDLLFDLAINICKENKDGFTLQEGCTEYSSASTNYPFQRHDSRGGCRRIFLAKKGITDDDISHNKLRFPRFLRTLSLAKNPKIKNIPASIFSKVRALRVLDLSLTSISTLPSSIGCLKLLRVLNLTWTDIEEVPQCIRSLKNLRVLLITGRNIIERVPDWISELSCLEHLVISANSMPKTTSELLSLRVLLLYCVVLSVEENGLLRLEDVKNLIRLQELSIGICCEAELQRMKEGVFGYQVNMRQLTIRNDIPSLKDSVDVPLFPERLTSMKELQYLCLSRFVVPSWICEFVNLKVLHLWHCHCSEYPALESLPSLITLDLRVNKKCRELREPFGKCGAFPKLRFLHIFDFPMLEDFSVLEGGSMPCIEEFRLTECKKVGRVEGLEQLKSLKFFVFHGSGTDECRESFKEEGEEWKKIKANNPYVRITLN